MDEQRQIEILDRRTANLNSQTRKTNRLADRIVAATLPWGEFNHKPCSVCGKATISRRRGENLCIAHWRYPTDDDLQDYSI